MSSSLLNSTGYANPVDETSTEGGLDEDEDGCTPVGAGSGIGADVGVELESPVGEGRWMVAGGETDEGLRGGGEDGAEVCAAALACKEGVDAVGRKIMAGGEVRGIIRVRAFRSISRSISCGMSSNLHWK